MNNGIVKLKDIAEKLGVSINTVSRALRDCPDIGEETKKKVKEEAEKMGYIKNNIINYLHSGQTNLIGIVISSITNPFFSIYVDKLATNLQNLGYTNLIILNQENTFNYETLLKLITYRVTGIISLMPTNKAVADYCADHKIPIVLTGEETNDKRICFVATDDLACGKTVAEYFNSKESLSRPCYVNCNDVNVNSIRRRGFISNVNSDVINEYYCSYKNREKYKKALLEGIIENKNDFIFCFNDEIASYVIEILDEVNYKDYTIFGVDCISKHLSITKKLNSVAGDVDLIVNKSIELLIAQINGTLKEAQHVLYNPIPMIIQ